MPRWMLGAIIVLGTILSLGVGLWATPVEITTQDQLFLALDQACVKAEQLQTASQVLCNQVKERLQEELQKRLQQHKSIKLDPDLLGEVLAWTAQWNRSGVDEALQLALGLTEMLDQGAYGKKLQELLAYGQAAGYSPEELTALVTQLAEMVTAWTPAEDVLDEALKHLDQAMPGESPEEILKAVQHDANNEDTPQGPTGFGTEAGMPSMNADMGQAEEGPAWNELPGDKGEGVGTSFHNPADNKQPENKPEWGHQPPSDTGGESEVIVPPAMDKKQPTDKGPEWSNQPPNGDEEEIIEVTPPTTTDEEEDEGASHGSGHKHGNSDKKGKSGKGK